MARPVILSGKICYHCGSSNYRKRGGTDNRNQKVRLQCRDCGKSFYDTPPKRRKDDLVISGFNCYHCGSEQTSKAGFSKYGTVRKQRFFCRGCRRYFREDPEYIEGQTEKNNFWVRKHLPSAGHLILELHAVAQRLGRTPQAVDIRELSKEGRGYPLNVYRAVFGTYTAALKRARLTGDYPRQYSPERMIAELKTLRKRLGRPLLKRDIAAAAKQGKGPSFHFLTREFGNVTNALAAAGAGRKKFTRAEMIEALRKLSSELGKTLRESDIVAFARLGRVPSTKVLDREFGGIIAARLAAGLSGKDER